MHGEEFKKELKERYAMYFYEKWIMSSEEWKPATFLEMDAYAKEQIFKDIF